MLQAIQPHAKVNTQTKLTPVYVNYQTRKTKLVLVLCPQWSIFFPPYNLPRLSGIAKSAGYDTTIIDLNIRSYKKYKSDWNQVISFDPWSGASAWRWTGDNYYQHIHPTLKPLLDNTIKEILELAPSAVGFSMYYTNEEPTKYMCSELKRINPDIKILIGGSNVQKSWFAVQEYYDYAVNGEGEQALLNILDEIENGISHESPQFITQPEEQRIDLNRLPFPDYDNISFNDYLFPNGVTTEFSRGCIAKCTFCEETHFWKYRQRQSIDLITEVEWLHKDKGIGVVWFVDSLINGNLKELKAFATELLNRNVKIKWGGYARHDGRMDLDYFTLLRDSGCTRLNFGSESASQRVLDYMDKKVTVGEMEDNFKHIKQVGMSANTNWIVGAPIERLEDFSNTLHFLWRMRNNNISNISTGVGFSVGPETIVGQNPSKFGISYYNYNKFWITNDFSMGGTHVLNRVKNITIFLDMWSNKTSAPVGYTVRPELPKNHYTIEFLDSTAIKEIEYESGFDYYIIKPNINPYADTLVNEIWPLLRILYKCFGGYKLTLKFNPEIDSLEFGRQHGSSDYYATHLFEINDKGEWNADFTYKYVQNVDSQPPFQLQENYNLNANTAKRAKILARLDTPIDVDNLIQEEHRLNNDVDFSFEHHYVGSGSWGNLDEFATSVSTSKNTFINIKNIIREK